MGLISYVKAPLWLREEKHDDDSFMSLWRTNSGRLNLFGSMLSTDADVDDGMEQGIKGIPGCR